VVQASLPHLFLPGVSHRPGRENTPENRKQSQMEKAGDETLAVTTEEGRAESSFGSDIVDEIMKRCVMDELGEDVMI
jgi:hypothetical protein